MDFKGTKGKWIIENDPEQKLSIYSDDEKERYNIVCFAAEYMMSMRYWEANAKLIASAPELLEMVKLLVDRMEENDLGKFNAVSRAKELIKKATE